MRRSPIVFALMAVFLTIPAGASPGASAEGVKSVTVSPTKIYEDTARITVRITTTGRARPGRIYAIRFLSHVPNSFAERDQCAKSSLIPDDYLGFRGGAGVTTVRVLTPEPEIVPGVGGDHFCAGAGDIQVWTQLKNGEGDKTVFRLPVRVYRIP